MLLLILKKGGDNTSYYSTVNSPFEAEVIRQALQCTSSAMLLAPLWIEMQLCTCGLCRKMHV